MTDSSHTKPRLLIVLNPSAGRYTQGHINAIIEALEQHGINAEVYKTRGPGDAITALKKLTPDFDIVVAAGGDGTINEVLNGIGDSAVTLGIIPCGSTNVLATELRLPTKPKAIATLLASNTTRNIYSGAVNGRRFAMMVGVGYDTLVVAGISDAMKQKLGKFSYVISMLRELKNFGHQQYLLQIDGSVHTASSVVATLGKHYAGPYIFARNARIDEATIDVVLVQTLNRWAFLLMLLALPFGWAEKLPFIKTVKAKRVRISHYPAKTNSSQRESLQADGDCVGYLPAELHVHDTPLKVLAPPPPV